MSNRKPRYPLFVFLATLLFGYLILHQAVTSGIYSVLGAIFLVIFSLSITCIIRSAVEQARTLHHGHSGITIAAGVLGISAFHVCGNAVCGYGLSFLLLSAALPAAALGTFGSLSILIIIISIALQVFAISRMKCYRNSLINLKNLLNTLKN